MHIRKMFWWGSSALSLVVALILIYAGIRAGFSLFLNALDFAKKDGQVAENSYQLNHSSWIYAVAMNSSGKLLAVGDYRGDIQLWDLERRSLLHVLPHHSDAVESLAFSPDGRFLLSGSWDNYVKVWDLTQAKPTHITLQGHIDDVQAIVTTPDSQRLVSGSYDGTIKIWDLNSGQSIQTFKGLNRLSALTLSPDGQFLINGNAWGKIQILNPQNGQNLQSISAHENEIRSIEFTSDGETLISGSYDKIAKIWKFDKTIKLSKALSGEMSSAILSIAISPDDRTVAGGKRDGTICLWQINTGELLQVFPGHSRAVWSIQFSPDGQTLVSGSSDTTVKLWPLENLNDFDLLK